MKLLEWLLRLCPEEFRRAHAEEIQDFAREEHAARCGGALSRIRFWLRLWVNVSLTAFRLRRAQRTRGRSAPVSELAHALVADVCRGVRSIHSTPLVSLVIILTLACGIGLNTAIYSVVHGVLLDPLPYDEPDQLVFLNAGWTSADFSHTSASHTGNSFRTLRREAKSFSDIAAVREYSPEPYGARHSRAGSGRLGVDELLPRARRRAHPRPWICGRVPARNSRPQLPTVATALWGRPRHCRSRRAARRPSVHGRRRSSLGFRGVPAALP